MSIFKTPALCEASNKYGILYFLHIFPISSAGNIVPVKFETCVVTINFVLPLIALSKSFKFIVPSVAHFTIVFSTPKFSNSLIGLKTELCSISVVTTWSPEDKMPFIAVFKLSVALNVKITFIGSSILKSSAKSSLVS